MAVFDGQDIMMLLKFIARMIDYSELGNPHLFDN